MTAKLLEGSEPHVCYMGAIPLFSAKSTREAIVRAVSLPLPLRLNSAYDSIIRQFKEQLGLHLEKDYTVVHWRRGDQLEARCAKHKDKSVNCDSATDLIKMVKDTANSDGVVYIATNEAAGSTEMQILRSAGFKVFADAKMDNLSVIETLMVEVALMLEATTFLAWGVRLMMFNSTPGLSYTSVIHAYSFHLAISLHGRFSSILTFLHCLFMWACRLAK